MSDEIKKERIASSDDVTTADLAGVEQRQSRRIEVETAPVNEARSDGTNAAIPLGPAAGAAATRARMDDQLGPLFSSDEANNLRAQWDRVQAGFVDEPRAAVEDADHLIAATMKRLAEVFANERQNLERQWDRGDNVSTEDLRLALRRYRSFFSRLLKV